MSAPFIRPGEPMCVLTLTYAARLAEVDRHMAAHVAWLERAYAQGLAVVSGRQNPRVGGIILMRGDRARVEALAATDPFVSEGVATVAVTEFAASMAAPALAALFA